MTICKKCGAEVPEEEEVKVVQKPRNPEEDSVIYIRKICRRCFNRRMKLYKRKYDAAKRATPKPKNLSAEMLRKSL